MGDNKILLRIGLLTLFVILAQAFFRISTTNVLLSAILLRDELEAWLRGTWKWNQSVDHSNGGDKCESQSTPE
jgi:hypothetical protein